MGFKPLGSTSSGPSWIPNYFAVVTPYLSSPCSPRKDCSKYRSLHLVFTPSALSCSLSSVPSKLRPLSPPCGFPPYIPVGSDSSMLCLVPSVQPSSPSPPCSPAHPAHPAHPALYLRSEEVMAHLFSGTEPAVAFFHEHRFYEQLLIHHYHLHLLKNLFCVCANM